MECKWCGADISEKDKFCGKCGKPLEQPNAEKYCLHCSKTYPSDVNFCPECGIKLSDSTMTFGTPIEVAGSESETSGEKPAVQEDFEYKRADIDFIEMLGRARSCAEVGNKAKAKDICLEILAHITKQGSASQNKNIIEECKNVFLSLQAIDVKKMTDEIKGFFEKEKYIDVINACRKIPPAQMTDEIMILMKQAEDKQLTIQVEDERQTKLQQEKEGRENVEEFLNLSIISHSEGKIKKALRQIEAAQKISPANPDLEKRYTELSKELSELKRERLKKTFFVSFIILVLGGLLFGAAFVVQEDNLFLAGIGVIAASAAVFVCGSLFSLISGKK